MAFNPGQPQGTMPYPQYPQPVAQYPQSPPQYSQSPPHYAQQAPQYAQQAPQYAQQAPQYPQQAPQYAQQTPQYPPSVPSSPPQLDGYKDIGFAGAFVQPPAVSLPSGPPPKQPTITLNREPLSSDEVKDALAGFVAQHCCYGSGPIKDMQIRSVAPTSTFKYTLETFMEKRETKWKCEPFSGSLQTSTGRPLLPWEVPVTPKQLFTEEKRVLQVPHTETLRPCHDCQAHGDVRCKHCAGRGQDRCGHCGGSGRRMDDACSFCGGVGTKECTWCNGRGMVTCQTCKGTRNLKYYVELTVTWQVHIDKYVVETPNLPDSQVAAVSGETVCQAQEQLVWPFTNFPETKIVTASKHLVQKHQTGWPMGRILQQRHDVQQIPIYSVSNHYDGKDGTFFICGREKNVFYPDYPSRCCGCCVVM